MKKGFGGFGIVAALVTLVIVLLLSARAWKSAMPAAQSVLAPGSKGEVPNHGDPQAGEALRSGNLPDMKDMKRETDRHAAEVKEAARQTGE